MIARIERSCKRTWTSFGSQPLEALCRVSQGWSSPQTPNLKASSWRKTFLSESQLTVLYHGTVQWYILPSINFSLRVRCTENDAITDNFCHLSRNHLCRCLRQIRILPLGWAAMFWGQAFSSETASSTETQSMVVTDLEDLRGSSGWSLHSCMLPNIERGVLNPKLPVHHLISPLLLPSSKHHSLANAAKHPSRELTSLL